MSKIVAAITAAYPGHFRGYTPNQLDNLINTWGMVLEDYTYQQASAGLKIFLSNDTKGFPPSPGQVVDCIIKVTKPESEQLTEAAAWAMVRKAIGKGIYNAKEEYEKFPEIVKKAVGSPAYIEELAKASDFNEGVESSNFYSKYRNCLVRDREDAKIPKSVKALIQKTAEQIELKE